MKVRTWVKKMCQNCQIVRRPFKWKKCVRVICENPKCKQRQG